MDDQERLVAIRRFYDILERLEDQLSGTRTLAKANGHVSWPKRGVYFFFEESERRSTSGSGPRVVRVGTHGLKKWGKSTLWGRLKQHQGSMHSGGGNHRGSVFRKHVGKALLIKETWPEEIAATWGDRSSANKETRAKEKALEVAVSQVIRKMPFLWLKVEDEPGPDSARGYIERNAIALLSNFNSDQEPIDPASEDWLGNWSPAEEIRRSGLWNVEHVKDALDARFLDVLMKFVE